MRGTSLECMTLRSLRNRCGQVFCFSVETCADPVQLTLCEYFSITQRTHLDRFPSVLPYRLPEYLVLQHLWFTDFFFLLLTLFPL